jgi:hypothetical protein
MLLKGCLLKDLLGPEEKQGLPMGSGALLSSQLPGITPVLRQDKKLRIGDNNFVPNFK